MGIWATQVTPRLVAAGSEDEKIRALRARACEGLHGEVVELGFGSGHNIGLYPAAVTRVVAVEPSDVAWELGALRRASSPIPIVRGDLDGQWLSLPDASADAVLSTFTLCTIPDIGRALAEVRRVLRPGAALHFLEHGIAPEEGVQRWQRILEPVQKKVFDGCHLTRPIDRLIEESGLVIETIERAYAPMPKMMRPWVFGYLGRAVRPV
ncbi:methyltransferase [Terrabacter tumescens]|uniref:Methyltransferase n=1 Tax=Terrabacter tumescens TaxID=60443 RepID=A0ABQ2HNT6_9MICO|nr:class I SAM-dependent methyltransferase [Terrabacter tumescens]GGM87372.1 methyltransferase [Terrabacter tumescens]